MAVLTDLLEKTVRTINNQWTRWWEGSNKKDEIAPAVLTISVVILATFWYLWRFVKSRKTMTPLPPGPHGLPIVGYLPFLSSKLYQTFAEMAHVYGPIYKLRLGSKLCVVLNSPSLAKEVLGDQDTTFANHYPPIAALPLTYGGIDITWSPYGSNWRMLSKVLVGELMSSTSLDACYDLRKQEVRKTIRDVHTKIGTSIDIGELIYQTEINVMMSLFWGSTPEDESVRAKFREVTSEITQLLGSSNISDFFPMLARFDIQGVEKKMRKFFLLFDQILNSIIDQRKKMVTAKGEGAFNKKRRKDFLQLLLEPKEQEDTATPITVTHIKAIFMDTVVGGTDTTTAMVEWVMAVMMHNPEIMKKSQEELAQVVGMNNIVEESHLPKLHYLDAVVKETFRLYPAVPLLIPRYPSKTSTVGGYTVPKGTKVFLNAWSMHRDPLVWDNPSEFKPERFLSDSTRLDYTGNNFQYLPFGSGRRICPGIPLSESMVMYVLASLLHSFEWQLPKGKEVDLSEKFGLVLKKSTPLIAIPAQRLSKLELYA